MKKLALAISIMVWMSGCGSSSPTVALISVTVNPAVPPTIDQGQTLLFTANLTNDTGKKGVTWSASGPGCAGAACGTFTSVTATSAVYNAPASVSTSLSVTVTATSLATPTQWGSSTFNVMPPPTIISTNIPDATPSELYNTTLTASGGVQPLNWSLASGTLPAGLHLNSAGIIYGMPTTGGTSNFTLKVTDSSGAPGGSLSTQQAFSLTVVGVLTVPAASLPAGQVGLAYTTTLSYSGGELPLTWGIYTGSLPSGLVLQQSTGVISGTPAIQGTYSFTVTVIDSSPTQQTFTSSTFTITINPSGPLAIQTTSLLNGTLDTAYQGQLVATGGSPPLSWTVTGGALPVGLALNPTTGAIAGTSTGAGTSTFTVAVTDTSSPPQTRTQQLSIAINPEATACTSSGSNSLLAGQYAFSLRGYNGVGFLAVVGSFTADGTGKITAGEADANGVLGAQTGQLLTSASSYSVGPDNRGCATLATPFGTFLTRFVLGGVSAGVATQGRIIEFDSPSASAYIAAGRILQQNSSAFTTPLTGSYALRTTGWDASASGSVACVGIVIAAKFNFSYLEQDCNDNGTVSNTISNATTTSTTTTNIGTYSTVDANGRGTATILVAGNASDFTFYFVSGTQLFIVNSDPSPTFSGEMQQVQLPFGSSGFNQGSLNGPVASYSNGLGLLGAGGVVSIGTLTADGSSTLTAQLYRNVEGAWQTPLPTSTTCTYSVVLIGRVTLSGGSCGANPPIPYVNALNSAYVLGTSSTVELGTWDPQTTGLTNAALAGTYYVGTSEVVSQSAQAEVGIITLTSGGAMRITSDIASTLIQTAGTVGSDTYSLKSNGTFSTGSSGGTVVGVAISSSKFVIIDNPTVTFPLLLIGQQ